MFGQLEPRRGSVLTRTIDRRRVCLFVINDRIKGRLRAVFVRTSLFVSLAVSRAEGGGQRVIRAPYAAGRYAVDAEGKITKLMIVFSLARRYCSPL